ncbi:MFS transporter [Marinomonas sp. S3726]|uniref:MFS transporter n=1 Tax=Marinomonas sp. S3726 TaxID=579484 RepID=UPI0005F9D917|nr:MFS transporter [Marinomonas sp. S3726]KJZ14149.1 MFS transporter [Marinomonas sp. S3726]
MPFKYVSFLSGRFFDGISSGMFMLALPWIMLEETQSGSIVALSTLACTLASFSLSPLLSTLIDRHSRKAILFITQVIQALTAFIVLAAFFYQVGNLTTLIFAQLVFWCSSDLAWKTNNAFVQENFSADEYPKITSYQEIIMQITTLGAGATGIVLLAQWGMQEFAAIAFIASFIGAISYGVIPYQRKLRLQHEASFLKQVIEIKEIFLKQKQLMVFLALSCLSYPVLTFLVKLVPIYFYEQGYSANWFAAWKLSFGIGALISGLIIRQLLIKHLPEKLMIACVSLIALALFASSLFSASWIIVGFALLFGLFNSVNRISRMNKMHHEIDLNERGRIEGGLHMFSTFIQSMSYMLIALLSHYDATQLGFSIMSLVMLLAAVFMLNLYQGTQKLIDVSEKL